jgi:hypothetical protein
MFDRASAKQRSRLVQPGYHRRPRFLSRPMCWCLLLAALAALAVPVYGLLRAGGERVYSRGPLARVHAAWDNRCDACHGEQPINDNTWFSVWTGKKHARHNWENLQCQGCHAAPAHHASVVGSSNCGGCHHDHQGRDFSLVRFDDAACTRCHRDLAAHWTSTGDDSRSGPDYATAIRGFGAVDGHPEFRKLLEMDGKYQRALKFNHALHMTAGMDRAKALGQGDTPEKYLWTRARIAAGEQYRYRYVSRGGHVLGDATSELVQLSCSSCHQLDAQDSKEPSDVIGGIPAPWPGMDGMPANAILPPRAAGRYFQPIVYENQCKACHPINDFDPSDPKREAPHRVQVAGPYRQGKLRRSPSDESPLETLDTFLCRYFTERVAAGKFQTDGVKWQPLDRLDPRDAEVRKLRDRVSELVEAARRELLSAKSCGKCHLVEGDRIVPPTIPTVWFEHANFNHVAHRAVDCKTCHARSYPDFRQGPAAGDWEKDLHVHIAGIDSCRECHAPAATAGGNPKGGVSARCTDCHRYHNGDQPWHGVGAVRRDPHDPKSGEVSRKQVEDFLRGSGAPR